MPRMLLKKLRPNINASVASNSAITAHEFDGAITPLAPSMDKPETLAVAVSGGADSMALLLLLKEWCDAHHFILHALTVDHHLRAESEDEALQVAQWCDARGVGHTTLIWQHGDIHSGIQARAREARYELMTQWCHQHHIQHLFTAHHLDDQIETFFFRLLRGSGLTGLSGIQPVSSRAGIFLHRPLLTIPKDRLIATLKHHQQTWIHDPSNDKLIYTRNKLRQLLHALSDAEKNRISQLTHFFQLFRNTLENNVSELINLYYTHHDAGYGLLRDACFREVPPALQTNIITHLCMLISGNAHPLRHEKLSQLLHALQQPDIQHKHTLHGVVFHYQPTQHAWLITREVSRISPAQQITSSPVLWDGRFLVNNTTHESYNIAALGEDWRHFKELLATSPIPKPVWPTLPAIFYLEECIAIPHIYWMHQTFENAALNLRFVPAKLLACQRVSAMNLSTIKKDKTKGVTARA